jgi:hypothetical protein
MTQFHARTNMPGTTRADEAQTQQKKPLLIRNGAESLSRSNLKAKVPDDFNAPLPEDVVQAFEGK